MGAMHAMGTLQQIGEGQIEDREDLVAGPVVTGGGHRGIPEFGTVRAGSLGSPREAVNLEGTRKVDGWRAAWLEVLLPSRCLLCAATAPRGRDLCAGCLDDLPRNLVCCARCALPLAVAAPLCGACLKREPAYASAWAPFQYGHPLNLLEARFKFRRDLAAGRVLADLLVDAARARTMDAWPECLLCVPLHLSRLRERGFNQALELARPLSRALGLPLVADMLVRRLPTRAQTGLDAKARRQNLRGAFAVRADAGIPRHVAIVDDVMTTGSTLDACARVLGQAGVDRVDVWALARAPVRR